MESEKRNEYELKLHPIVEEEFIGTIEIDESSKKNAETMSSIETVIILDRSGSMADAVKRVSNEIIPLFLSKLSYESHQSIHFMTFESKCELFLVTVERMKSLPIRAQGGTNMAPAVRKCEEIFKAFDKSKPIRVLTVSDGQVSDSREAEKAATEFASFCKDSNFSINSQAVRLFTSESQPDTTALCSLLQINNTTSSHLTDISTSESNEVIATKIADLFKDDNLLHGQNLSSKDENIMKFPWESNTSQLTLVPGVNMLWLKGLPSEDLKIGDESVKVHMQSPVTLLKFQSLIGQKLEFIVDHMKILKVVGTEEAEKDINRILEYFERTEETLTKKSTMVKYFNADPGHKKKISSLLTSIAEDKNVKNFDSAQKAEYLRKLCVEKTNASLIERAANFGVDIDSDEFKNALLVIFILILALIVKMVHDFFKNFCFSE